MLKTETPQDGLLFASFLYRRDFFQESELVSFWEGQFGESVNLNPSINPLFGYYSKEMGENLSRVFLLTHRTYPREFLLTTKLLSLNWEQNWAREQKRQVNVDIGFLSAENFILSTTKNYAHRIYLGQNIFADLTYYFQFGQWQVLPWTYPDYLDEEKKEFFLMGRSYLLKSRNS